MNGRLDAASPALAAGPSLGGRWRPAPESGSLMLPLACSCAIHLFILFFPMFGTVGGSGPPAAPNTRSTPSSFSVTLTSFHSVRAEDWHPLTARAVPAELSAPEAKPVTQEQSKPADSRMDGADLLPLPGVIYYPTSFLTVRPQPLAAVDLDPPRTRPIVASGKVILTLWINPLGQTSKVAVVSTDLPGIFVETAVAAFEGLRFKPGELYSQRVGAVMKIEVTYDDGRLLSMEVLQ